MREITPEIQKQMEESGIPIIRLSLEDLAGVKAITNPKEVEDKPTIKEEEVSCNIVLNSLYYKYVY